MAPKMFEPIFIRKLNRDIDAAPWCQGFCAAMNLRVSAWAPLRNPAGINHALPVPILLHCVDDHGHPLLSLPAHAPPADPSRQAAYKEIPAAVEAMRRTGCQRDSKRGRSNPSGCDPQTAYA
jgi:uncharacterized protein